MNKLVLSLSVLSLCCFISIDGWAGEFHYNNSNTLSQKPTPQPAPPVSTMPSTGSTTSSTSSTTSSTSSTTSSTSSTTPSTGSTTPQSSCVQQITTTYSDGTVKVTEISCDNQPSNGSSGGRTNY